MALGPTLLWGAAGDLYVAQGGSQQAIVELTPSGSQSTVATLPVPTLYIAVDGNGSVYASQGTTVAKITNGVVSTFVSGFAQSRALAFDRSGNLFVGDTASIVSVSPAGTKSTFTTGVKAISHMAFDRSGNLFVTDNGLGGNASVIYKFSSTGARSTFASGLNNAEGLAFDAAGNLFLAETGSQTIYKFTPAGVKTVFTTVVPVPRHLAFDVAGNLFVSNGIDTVYKVTPAGLVSTFKSVSSASGLAFERPLSQPLNISTRLNIQTGDNVLIAGFIASGTVAKKLLVRGIGPSLTNSGVPGALQDPTLEVRASNGVLIATNDNWKIDDKTLQSQQSAVQATGAPPTDDRESALALELELAPGAYTAIERGKRNTTGVGLVEVYDLNQTADSKLANISTRGFVAGGDSVMIGGFIIGAGNGASKVIVRAIGPSLAAAGITNPLPDPFLEIHNGNGALLVSNDNWKTTQQAEIEASGVPPTNDLEASIVTTLPIGNYTAIVSGQNNSTGVALVEAYNLRTPLL